LETSETKPLGGGVIDFGATPVAARNKSLHSTLVREPFFALRFGELYLEGWQVRKELLKKKAPVKIDHDDIEPAIRQKGVDMRSGRDIASLTLQKHVEVIVRGTADSGFAPAMKFARREGAQLRLITPGHGERD